MSEAAHEPELIIVRRHEEEEHAHHSSAWKVAHADFMTAMMAFFLIMWLINVTDDEVRKGISQYFNPIHLSTGSVEMKGLNAPSDSNTKSGSKVGHSDSPPNLNPVQLTAGQPDPIALAAAEKALADAAKAVAADAPKAGAGAADAAGPGTAAAASTGPEAGSAADAKSAAAASAAVAAIIAAAGGEAAEDAAFRDPYAILAQLAEKYTLDHPTSVDKIVGDDRPPGVASGEVDRDPFDPVYWQIQPLPPARSDSAGSAASAAAVPPGATPDAQATTPQPEPDSTAQMSATQEDVATAAPPPPPPAAKSQATPITPPAETSPPAETTPPAAEAVAPPDKIAAETVAASKAVGAEIAKSIQDTMAAEASPDVSVKATPEGVLINLTDDAGFSMFSIGSAIPDPKMVVLMGSIAKVLTEQKGDVVVRGYTDGRPFHSDTYDNWRLSAARAHMAYFMLLRGGLAEERVVAIEGHADRNLKNPDDPFAAENRRIEILLKGAGT